MATYKQKKYIQRLVENGGNKYKSAKEAGYSDAVAKDAKAKIEKSKGFQELAKKYLLPDHEAFQELNKNIKQDKDKGAKNKALQIWKSWKYPEENQEMEAGDIKILISKD